MLRIGKTILSLDIIEEKFVCDTDKCKGICCVHGDSGAPLTDGEIIILDKDLKKIMPFLRNEGIETIRARGAHHLDEDNEEVTPLVDGKECAYVVFENGISRCGIENAFRAGKTSLQKPISCHLYPVRVKNYDDFEAMNYDRWQICNPARECGKNLNVPVYRFVREALVRRYGKEWFRELCVAAEKIKNKKHNP